MKRRKRCLHGMDIPRCVRRSREGRNMGFLELAAARYSVRSYSDRPIETEKMEKILKAGQLAPTAVNF